MLCILIILISNRTNAHAPTKLSPHITLRMIPYSLIKMRACMVYTCFKQSPDNSFSCTKIKKLVTVYHFHFKKDKKVLLVMLDYASMILKWIYNLHLNAIYMLYFIPFPPNLVFSPYCKGLTGVSLRKTMQLLYVLKIYHVHVSCWCYAHQYTYQ